MASNIEILKDKLVDSGRHEAAGKIDQAMAFYPDVEKFARDEFPHWSDDMIQVMSMIWSMQIV